MSLWIPITIAAALFQTVRFMLQRQLSLSKLSAGGATLARFMYSSPLIVVLIVGYVQLIGEPLPNFSVKFWIYCSVGGVAQIFATICVVSLFHERNFAVGITFKKSESIIALLIGWLIFGVVGVLMLSAPPDLVHIRLGNLVNRASGLGLASGLLFAVSAVSYRGASLSLDVSDPIVRAGLTLAVVTVMQTFAMIIWLRLREPGQVSAVWNARHVAVWVGLMSMAGSFCWFLAFTLQNAALVKALGQVELIFTAVVSVFIFRESVSGREWLGMLVLLASILSLIFIL
jgi:drug/metabolite transporter (DMT)-like permease